MTRIVSHQVMKTVTQYLQKPAIILFQNDNFLILFISMTLPFSRTRLRSQDEFYRYDAL